MVVVFPPDLQVLQTFIFITWKEHFSCSVGFSWMWRRFLAGEVPASWAEPAHFVVAVFHLGCHSSSFFSHLPKSDRSGLLFVLSLSRKVHGRMYTDISRAFSSGENCDRGILAKDHVGRYGRGRFCQHQQCRRPFRCCKFGMRIRSSSGNAV